MAEESTFTNFGQVGIIVKDMEKTIAGLKKAGIGPFGPLQAAPTIRWEERGKPTEVKIKMKFATVGPLEIELIEPTDKACLQKEWLDRNGEGIHHIAFFVNSIDEEVAKMAKKGFKVVQRGWRSTGGGYAFFDTVKECGFWLEIIQRP